MNNNKTFGSLAVALAYASWGLLTLFWNLLAEVNSLYILAQRILWSMVFMGIFIAVTKDTKEIKSIFKNRRDLLICFICGMLITVNWGTYIYAVNSGHVLDASLGYFIEPIVVSVIGMLTFKERLSRFEKITFFFSVLGLAYMIAVTRVMPLLALVIAGSFAVYGAVKKMIHISAQASLFMETLCMTPFALIFTVIAEQQGFGSIGVLSGPALLLLPACGVITSVPLLLFNIGVKKIPYYVSGILMYINPTLQFLMGLCYFHEAMDIHRLIAFIIIWFGILFTVYEKAKLIYRENHPLET